MLKRQTQIGCLVAAIGLAGFIQNHDRDAAFAQPGSKKSKKSPPTAQADKLVPLNPAKTVLLDRKGKRILLKGKVVLRKGLLEMLCCLKQTKEHESILSVDTKAYLVHTALLALGAKKGAPVEFTPKFKGATGERIDVFLQWKDKKGKLHRDRAQTWLRHVTNRFYVRKMKALPPGMKLPKDSELRFDKKNEEFVWYGHMTAKQRDQFLKLSQDKQFRKHIQWFHDQSQIRQMNSHWVFAGSGFFIDEKTNEKFYQAEGGDLICVANFPSATIDVAIESSSKGEQSLLFEAYEARIPPVDTEVTIELVLSPKRPKTKTSEPSKKNAK